MRYCAATVEFMGDVVMIAPGVDPPPEGLAIDTSERRRLYVDGQLVGCAARISRQDGDLVLTGRDEPQSFLPTSVVIDCYLRFPIHPPEAPSCPCGRHRECIFPDGQHTCPNRSDD